VTRYVELSEVKSTVIDLVKSNESVLMNGISHQGVQRSVLNYDSLGLLSPTDFYSVTVLVQGGSIYNRNPNSSSVIGLKKQSFDVTRELIDYIVMQQSDGELYSSMYNDLTKVGDRLTKILYDSKYLSILPDNIKLVLPRSYGIGDRLINISNSSSYDRSRGEEFIVMVTLQFKLET